MDFSSITGFATQVANEFSNSPSPQELEAIMGAFFAAFMIFFIVLFMIAVILFIAFYIYFALALSRIAKKTNTPNPWLAWIPIANIFLLANIAGMHWWPILLYIPTIVGYMLYIAISTLTPENFLIAGLIYMISLIPGIVAMVYIYIWWWKIFEKVGRPGWWVLLTFIPIAGPIIFIVLIGVAAWGKGGNNNLKSKKRINL